MKRKSKAKWIIAVILPMIVAFAVSFALRLKPAAEQYAAHDIKNALTDEIYRAFYSLTERYENMISGIVRQNVINGEIVSLNIDSGALNRFASELTFEVTRRLEDKTLAFSLPIGNFTPFVLFSGRGPGIKLKTVPLGSVSVGTESELKSAGINQTLHRIVIRVNALVSVLAPFSATDVEISGDYVICETLIIGKVPEMYYIRDAIP